MGRGDRKGRSRRGGASDPGPGDGGPVAGVYEIDTGTCELVPDRFTPHGWVLKVNGVESSHVDLDDPRRLDFEYMRWFAALIEPRWAADHHLRALHLGGGACSMARYLADGYPDARQVVVEIDAAMAELVRGWFDLPRAPRLRLRAGEARTVLESLREETRDVIIRDVFSGAVTPQRLTTAEFTAEAVRVLAPGGIYMVNCGDTRDRRTARREAATMLQAFAHVVIVSDPAMLAGRRTGNIVLAGSDAPLGESPDTMRALLRGAVPARLWEVERVRRFASGAQVLRDAVVESRPGVVTGGGKGVRG
ncbi:spermidine synthase [Tomitella fengzijianii]|uniref:Methyltransferase domain-containing protein n=1 Tax=Tomitella fengzijianii TaxID=2597660 RepID=A0A516X6C1_9ACTN|nr:fused MFS/spermidine synthase [Tomitella fengzijianii]QDQ98624.1 methyltransferase domain-containing protein [Tomitella fengzijianii]